MPKDYSRVDLENQIGLITNLKDELSVEKWRSIERKSTRQEAFSVFVECFRTQIITLSPFFALVSFTEL